MPKMSPEQRAELERQLQEDDAADNMDDFEIEIFTPEGHGARLPYSKGRAYLAQHFGIDAEQLPKPDASANAGNPSTGGKTRTPANSATDPNGQTEGNSQNTRISGRYFGGHR